MKIKKKLAQEFKEQLTIGTPSEQDEIALRKLLHQLKDGKVIVKLFVKHQLHAKLYLAYGDNRVTPVLGLIGSSNLTFPGLSHQGELNVDVLEQDAAVKLSKWFDDRWNDRWCLDITNELIEILETSWATEDVISPYHVYLKMAYHLSQEARSGINEFKLLRVFQEELFDFQQKAVLIAAHHLNKRGGVVIGDVVGLGKTITATAIAKMFEEDRYFETLIICPKNLKPMWENYVYKYQLHAKIISHSMVQSDLPDLRRYRIVIIDESHNLRNNEGSRYRAIKSYLEENESKVILLSATPYNKSYLDLSNQLRLFIPDDSDLGISPERYIEHLGGAIQFQAKHTDTHIRSIKAFEKSDFTDDWRELMKLFLIRRTRSFIKSNYARTDNETQRKYLLFSDGTHSYFPDRIPLKVEFKLDPNDKKDQYAALYCEKVQQLIDDLSLPRYGLGKDAYLDKKSKINLTNSEQTIIQNLSRAGKQLVGFCRTNLFKRLESSGYSFLLSLSRHVLRNFIYIYALERNLPLPIGKQSMNFFDDFLEDKDEDGEGEKTKEFTLDEGIYLEFAKKYYQTFTNEMHSKFEWIRSEYFKPDLKKALVEDSKIILKIMGFAPVWDCERDRKLNALYDLLTNKHSSDKVLVFTQFADTADYIGELLVKRGLKDVVVVTGDSDDPTNSAQRFSPVSNEKPEYKKKGTELRVLITTDVLSEGQNLQDAHIVVNFDLPWAIIRLIQRAGRVDRLGQKSSEILCYSFLPEDSIEQIIKLRSRLKHRIKQNAEVVGSDEVFFDGDPINIEDLYSEKAGVLDEEDDEVDLASYAYQIWKNATDRDENLKKIIPNLSNVIYSTKQNTTLNNNQGVVVYAKTAEDNDVLTWLNTEGNVITQSQFTILKAVQCDSNTAALPKLENHHAIVKSGIEKINDDESKMGGTLGRKNGVKYRVYMRLSRYCAEVEGTLFETEQLKKALDQVYRFPLKESAIDVLNRQMKSGIADDILAELVVSLREEDRLCFVETDDIPIRLPQIICSMGLVKQQEE